jgi:hypothetical protein
MASWRAGIPASWSDVWRISRVKVIIPWGNGRQDILP